jgi:hypothetical protein
MSKAKQKVEQITITPPNFKIAEFRIIGTAPYVQHRFFKKAEIMATQEAGPKAKNRNAKQARNFESDYEQSAHVSEDGWYGIPAPSFRCAMISACRVAGYVMTKAKLTVFIEPDGFERQDGIPLVRIDGEPEMHTAMVKNQTGVIDIRARAMFRKWAATVRVRWDADQFEVSDVMNLFARAGMQVGIGEGRPDSKKSAGMGWGLWRMATEEEASNAA